MSTPHTVAAGSSVYEVLDDVTLTRQALIVGQAIDELTGRPPLDSVRVVPTLVGVARTAPGEASRFAVSMAGSGTFALAGSPDRAFPDLAVHDHAVQLVVRSGGYLDSTVLVDVAKANTSFPLPVVPVPMRRPAVRLRGRVTQRMPPFGPVAGAQVEVAGPAGMVGLHAPLAFDHAQGAQVASFPVSLDPLELDLVEGAFPGDVQVSLATRTNLSAGSVLQIGKGLQREYGVVTGLTGPSDLARPGRALLQAPLSFGHPVGEQVRRAQPGAQGQPTTLTRDAFAQDELAFVNDPTVLTDGSALAIDSIANRVEYRVAVLPLATSDKQGYYRLGPVGRALNLIVQVAPPGPPTPQPVTHFVDYDQPVNVLNLRA